MMWPCDDFEAEDMSISEEGQPEMTADRTSSDFAGSTSSGSDPHSNQAMQEKSLELNGWQLLQEKHWGDAALVFGQLLEINRANEGALQERLPVCESRAVSAKQGLGFGRRCNSIPTASGSYASAHGLMWSSEEYTMP